MRLSSRIWYALSSKRDGISQVIYTGLFFVSSALIGAVAQSLLTDPIPGKDGASMSFGRYLAFILVALVGTLIGVATVLIGAFETIRRQKAFDVSIQRDYPTLGAAGAASAYNKCTAAAMQATSSIIVVGPHFKQNLVGTSSHNDYLTSGMEAAIKRHVDSPESDFVYKRIVQLDGDAASEIENDGEIDKNVIGNEALARHIQNMITLNEQSHSVYVKVYGRSFIPSFPSTLIIDDKYVFFSLPSKTSATSGATDLTGAPPVLNYDFVLSVEDQTGVIPKAFRKMISQFEVGSREIKMVKGLTNNSDGPQI